MSRRVVDVHRYFTRQRPTPMYPSVEGVLERLKRFGDECRAGGVLVVCIRARIDVVTLDDCTAEVTQARHESGLATLAANFGIVCSSADVLAAWNGGGWSNGAILTGVSQGEHGT